MKHDYEVIKDEQDFDNKEYWIKYRGYEIRLNASRGDDCTYYSTGVYKGEKEIAHFNREWIQRGIGYVDELLENKLNELEQFEKDFAHVDLSLVAKIAKDGLYAVRNFGEPAYYGNEEIKVNFYDERFESIYLNEEPSEDENCWYEEVFPFKDFGKYYFLTKEEAEKRTDEMRANNEKVPVNWRSL